MPILRRESKFYTIKFHVSTHSACPCKNYVPNYTPNSPTNFLFFFLLLVFVLVCNFYLTRQQLCSSNDYFDLVFPVHNSESTPNALDLRLLLGQDCQNQKWIQKEIQITMKAVTCIRWQPNSDVLVLGPDLHFISNGKHIEKECQEFKFIPTLLKQLGPLKSSSAIWCLPECPI